MKKVKYAKFSIFTVIWIVGISWVFNVYGYKIDNFNAATRVFVTAGALDVRTFDESGIPQSYSPRLGKYVSPFYVVHYGIVYSNGLMDNGGVWEIDPSLSAWNVPIDISSEKTKINFFKKASDWVVNNISKYDGKDHLIYDFDWPYKKYPSGKLSAPWWSGLTDGYAIILMLRANDYFGGDKYLDVARRLYSSVTAPVSKGGSRLEFNGCDWIEEYVDHNVRPKDMSHVLNGMVYATYGIEDFENGHLSMDKYSNTNIGYSNKLYSCIEHNIEMFDAGGWSYYDAVHSRANIKYHKVNYELLLNLIEKGKITKKENVTRTLQSWRFGVDNPGLGFAMFGPPSLGRFQFILSWFLVAVLPLFLALLTFIVKNKRKCRKR